MASYIDGIYIKGKLYYLLPAGLQNQSTIDGVSFDGTASIIHYAVCNTAAATKAKVASITGFTLDAGAVAEIKFLQGNTATSPTLNINGTGARSLVVNNSVPVGYLSAEQTITVVYDGTKYIALKDPPIPLTALPSVDEIGNGDLIPVESGGVPKRATGQQLTNLAYNAVNTIISQAPTGAVGDDMYLLLSNGTQYYKVKVTDLEYQVSVDASALSEVKDTLNSVVNFACNENELDNWYFPNCVDQRQGRVVPPNTQYYATWPGEVAGYTDNYYSVTEYTYSRATFTINGTTVYTDLARTEPGYTSQSGNGSYTIDRWRFMNSNGVVTFGTNGGIVLHNTGAGYGYFTQIVSRSLTDMGSPRVISILFADGTMLTGANQLTAPSGLYFYQESRGDGTMSFNVRIPASLSQSEEIIAIKLEVGTQQTLAHQQDPTQPVWTMNGPAPRYDDELRKCQRYFVAYSDYVSLPTLSALSSELTNRLQATIITPVPMASLPDVSKVSINWIRSQTQQNNEVLSTDSTAFALRNNHVILYFTTRDELVASSYYSTYFNTLWLSCEL